MLCLFLCHMLVQKRDLWPHSSPFYYIQRHCPSYQLMTILLVLFFSFLLFLKAFLPNLHSSSSLGFCFSFWHYAFKITIEKLRSQEFLSGGTSSTFIHFLGTTHYSSSFFFFHLALNAEGGFSLQAATGYMCVCTCVYVHACTCLFGSKGLL